MKTYGQNRPDGQDAVLRFIREFYSKNGLPATIRQIQTGCGFKSTRAVSYHIEQLLKQGRVRMAGERRAKRCIPLLAKKSDTVSIKVSRWEELLNAEKEIKSAQNVLKTQGRLLDEANREIVALTMEIRRLKKITKNP